MMLRRSPGFAGRFIPIVDAPVIEHVTIWFENKGFGHVGWPQPAGEGKSIVEENGKLDRILLCKRDGLGAGHGVTGYDAKKLHAVRTLFGCDAIEFRHVTLGDRTFGAEKNKYDGSRPARFAETMGLSGEVSGLAHSEEIVARLGGAKERGREEHQT